MLAERKRSAKSECKVSELLIEKKHKRTIAAFKKAEAGQLSFFNKTQINCGAKVKQYIFNYPLFLKPFHVCVISLSMRFLYILLFVSFTSYSQHQERKIALYNIGFGAFTSAVGAVLNKPKNADWKPYFARGFWQGSLGGALSFAGKKTNYFITRDRRLLFAWPAKLLHAAGTSIVENAARNERFLLNWNIDFGPARFDFSINGNKGFKARILPVGIYSIVDGLSKGKFDASATIKTGNITFKTIEPTDREFDGYSSGRAVVYVANNTDKYHAIAHEIIHQFQFREYQVFNSWINPLSKHVKSEKLKSVFDRYIYFDIPYLWPFYGLEGKHSGPKYYRNFFELEAERLSTNRYVQVQ